MTDSNQVKEALAALADGKAGQDDRTDGPSAAKTADSSAVRERSRHRTGADQQTDSGRGTGADQQTDSGRRTGADRPTEYRAIIERASNATDDIDAAAAFVEEIGVTRLETAVAEAEREVSGLADDGRVALAAFERFRAAADGTDGGRHCG